MRFLIDADLPRSACDVVRRHGHEAVDVRDVVLNLPRNAAAAYINRLVDGFLQQETLLAQLPGKLAIVEAGRVRLRES